MALIKVECKTNSLDPDTIKIVKTRLQLKAVREEGVFKFNLISSANRRTLENKRLEYYKICI